MSKGTTLAEWVVRPVHHLLIAAYPVLFLLANNLGEMEPREGLVPAIVAIGSAAVLFVLLRSRVCPRDAPPWSSRSWRSSCSRTATSPAR